MKNTLSYLTLFAALSIPGMVYAKGDQWRDCCCSDYNLKGEHGEKEQRGIAGQCCPSPYQENDDLSSCKEACYDTQGHGRSHEKEGGLNGLSRDWGNEHSKNKETRTQVLNVAERDWFDKMGGNGPSNDREDVLSRCIRRCEDKYSSGKDRLYEKYIGPNNCRLKKWNTDKEW